MKKINILLFFSLCFYLTNAQITFLTTDIATAGYVDAHQKDTTTGAVNWGNRGANQVYDFSAFHNDAKDTIFYLTPTSAQTTAVPGTTLAITGDHNTYIFAKNAATLFDYTGGQTVVSGNAVTSAFSPIDTGYKFPTTYGQNFRGTYGFQTTLPGSAIGQSSIYQVRLTNTTTYTDTIDGWGKVKTPVGTYNCLREHRVEHSSTLLEYKLLSISPWATVPTSSTLPSNPVVSVTNKYNYLTKESHGTVITFTYDSANNPLTASWSTAPPFPVANFGYTTGSNGSVAFTDSSTGAPLTYSWNFGDGSSNSTATNPNHSYTANGTYYVCLTVTNTSGTNTKCDSVHITNIASGSPPIAQITPAGHDTICPGGSVVLRAQTGAGYTFLWSDASHSTTDSIIVTTGGAYTVTVYNSFGNTVSAPTTIVVASTPNSTISLTGAATFCAGDSAVLSAAAGLTYHWSTTATSQNIIVHATGNYIVTVTNSNGCTASSQQHITVNTPAADSITAAGLVLTSLPESSYQWYRGSASISGATSQTYTATQNGVYSVAVTDANGCSTVSNSITITGVGISEISTADIKIYPNPASDMIQLDLSHVDQASLKDLSIIVVYDMLGNKVKTAAIDTRSISVKDLSNGVYMIGVVDKNETRKILGKFEVLK